jgi:hypothetical protein
MVTAGRERQNHAFVVEALLEHVRTHLGALDRLERHGYEFPERSVTILALRPVQRWATASPPP